MVPDYLHEPQGTPVDKKGEKGKERILMVEGKRLVTYPVDSKYPAGFTGRYVVVPGFIQRGQYRKASNDIPVSEIISVKEDEENAVLDAVEREYGTPRQCITIWP